MDPVASTTGILRTTVTLELLDEVTGSTPVQAELGYDRKDPFAVLLSIADADRAVVWAFSRELLSDGLHEPSGDGDVHVWPCLDAQGRATVLIELSTEDGSALLQANPREVRAFLELTHSIVAVGEESVHLDVAALIEAIFAAAPPAALD